jgi:Tfp pilus assembly PilM family ATPase
VDVFSDNQLSDLKHLVNAWQLASLKKRLPSSTHHSAFAVSTLISGTITSWVSLDRHQARQHLQKCGVKEACEMSPSKDLKFSY